MSDTFRVRPCPYCDGAGATAQGCAAAPCEECDGTGRLYRATWTDNDGRSYSMSGSGSLPPSPSDRAVMELVARAALAGVAPPEAETNVEPYDTGEGKTDVEFYGR